MKKIIFPALCMIVGLFACKKNDTPAPTYLLLHNASWSLNDLAASWKGISLTSTALAPGGTSGNTTSPYLPMPAGTGHMLVQSGSNVLTDKNIYAAASGAYSLIVYDTSGMVSAPRALLLADDTTAADTTSIKYRFLYCAYDTTTVSLVIARRTANDAIKQSVAYIGTSVEGSSINTFSTTAYDTATVKVVGTYTGTVLASVANVPLTRQHIYTFVYSGLRGGTGNKALKLSIIHHNVVQ